MSIANAGTFVRPMPRITAQTLSMTWRTSNFSA